MVFLRSNFTFSTVAAAAILLLVASTFGPTISVSAEQPVVGDIDDTNLLATIEVTLPAGVSTQDEDIADVIDSLIRGDTSKNGRDHETPTPAPKPAAKNPPHHHQQEQKLQQEPSRKETMFRQQFTVENNREFADEELELFQDLLEQYTIYFAPLSPIEVESKITTDCTVRRQDLLTSGDRRKLHINNNAPPTMLRHGTKRQRELLEESLLTLQVDFTMIYESMHYDVTEYPKLFQNWTANNLDVVLEQMKFLNMDIVSVDMPKRIVLMTPPPATSSPTSFPIITKEVPKDDSILLPDTNGVTIPVPTSGGSRWSTTAVILFSVALVIAIAILTVGISIVLGNRQQSSNRHHDDRILASAELAAAKTSPESSWKSTTVARVRSYQDDTVSTMDMEMVESSSSVFP